MKRFSGEKPQRVHSNVGEKLAVSSEGGSEDQERKEPLSTKELWRSLTKKSLEEAYIRRRTKGKGKNGRREACLGSG